ncbi:MAG: hypothetical protein IJO87_07350 [Eggerthellaceae bacterium]|nr:hypothetical protein [Eggerthellaceae bacterium]
MRSAFPHEELAFREALLRDIERRVAQSGPHVARAHPDRARQFMPFAALKGYHELAKSKELDVEHDYERDFEPVEGFDEIE